jgi:hypothetical protein
MDECNTIGDSRLLFGIYRIIKKRSSQIFRHFQGIIHLIHFPPHSFYQDEPEIVLGILVGSDHLDGESVFASCGENIDSACFHCWAGFVWMPASLIEGPGRAEAARSGPQAKRLIVPRKKSLPFHFDSDCLCIVTFTFE